MTKKQLEDRLHTTLEALFDKYRESKDKYYDRLENYGVNDCLTEMAHCDMCETMGKISMVNDFMTYIVLLEDVK